MSQSAEVADKAWATAAPRIEPKQAREMIGNYAAHLARAIACLPPSKRAGAFSGAVKLVAHELRLRGWE